MVSYLLRLFTDSYVINTWYNFITSKPTRMNIKVVGRHSTPLYRVDTAWNGTPAVTRQPSTLNKPILCKMSPARM